MRKTLKYLLPAAILAIGLAATGAEAAPAGAGLAPLGSAPEASTMAEKTYWVRKCHRARYGRVVCHRVWVAPRKHYRKHHRHYGRPHHHRRYR